MPLTEHLHIPMGQDQRRACIFEKRTDGFKFFSKVSVFRSRQRGDKCSQGTKDAMVPFSLSCSQKSVRILSIRRKKTTYLQARHLRILQESGFVRVASSQLTVETGGVTPL